MNLAAVIQRALAGGACTISWGDGTRTVRPLQPNGSGYSCSFNHNYGLRGRRKTITFVANDVSSRSISRDSNEIDVR